MDAKESQEDLDIEKIVPRIVEEVEGLPELPIARTVTASTPLMDLDKGLVGWDSVDDHQNPLNWPSSKRLTDMILMSVITFLSPLGSSIFAPGIDLALHDLHTSSQAVGSLMITIFLLGYALGPLFLSPLSEIYGRYPIVVLSSWFFVAFLLGCSFAPSMAGLIVMRFLAGTGGSAVMAIAPAIVADLYPLEHRGLAMGTILIVQSVSPSTGPICGGFIAQQLGWRWAYWILVIASGTVTLLMTLFLFEPYAPAILEKKTRRLRKELDRPEFKSKLALQVTKAELMKRSLIRPLKLLTRSPAVFLFSLYVATIYGMLYLSFTTIPTVFTEVYGFSVELTGLAYIPFGIGMIICLSIFMKTSDKVVMKQRQKNNGIFEPEMRLPGVVYIAAFQGPALLVYGWTTEKHVHWIVPIISLAFFGFGMVGVFMPCQTYVVDTFPRYAASAVAATTCLRSIVGTFLPFAGPPLLSNLGLGWGNTVLGLIALAMTPLVELFRRYGGTIRRKYPVDL